MTVISTNIRDQLGKTGSFDLAGSVLNGYTRTHAGSGYRRINPFQVENGNAPPTFTAPHVTTEWEAYVHTTVNSGTGLLISADGYGEIDLAWSLPSGYSRDTANLTQRVYWKDAGTVLDESALAVNPFDTPTGSASAGDGTTHTITGLTTGHFYAVGVKVEWNDSVTTHENVDSLGYAIDGGETPLTGGGRGLISSEVFGTVPNFSALIQTTDSGTCQVGDDVNLRLTVNMEGVSTGRLEQSKNSAGYTLVDGSVTAGTTTINLLRSSPDNWKYRIRYNDIGGGSPGPWSVERNLTAQCDLV